MIKSHVVTMLVLLLAGAGWSQLPPEIVRAEQGKLLTGVKSVPKPGAPGPVAVWGALAFPVLTGPDRDGVRQAVGAAAGFGKGRVVLFGHSAFVDANSGGDHPILLDNCIRWAANRQKPRVSVKAVGGMAEFERKGYALRAISGPVTRAALNECDVLVINIQGVTSAEEGAALVDFVRGGGGLVAAMTGWAFVQTSRGKNLQSDHAVNQALLQMGVGITDLSAFDSTRTFEPNPEPPALVHAGQAINALRRQHQGQGGLTPQDAKQAGNAIQTALAAQPPGRNSLHEAVISALGGAGRKSPVPTAAEPLKQTAHAEARILLGMETRLLKSMAADTGAHPAAAVFPGPVPRSARRIPADIEIDPNIPGWAGTGLYAAAGETIQVTVPQEQAGKGYAVRIGCHTDTLYHLDEWKRAPDISKSISCTQRVTTVSSAFGGLIYIDVPEKAGSDQRFAVTIQGGVMAPSFVLGRDDDNDWNSAIKHYEAPWAELACRNLVLSCPSEVARTINNPTALMQFWEKVVAAQDEISNQAAERRRPERIVADVQISAGYMHSGYPIMVPTSAAAEMVTLTRLKFPGWGFYHEIGHNHQRGDFTFEGTGEVTNNVLGMYVYEAVLGKDWLIGHPAISPEARRENLAKLRDADDKWALWKRDPFVALTSYIQLVQAFGWDSWRQYLHSFAKPEFGPRPANDDDKRDQFLVRYSRIVGRNLGPFFDECGIPVSAAAKAKVASLPEWVPPRGG